MDRDVSDSSIAAELTVVDHQDFTVNSPARGNRRAHPWWRK